MTGGEGELNDRRQTNDRHLSVILLHLRHGKGRRVTKIVMLTDPWTSASTEVTWWRLACPPSTSVLVFEISRGCSRLVVIRLDFPLLFMI